MQIDKKTVAQKLRTEGEHDRAQQAEVSLPKRVGTERDANLLRTLDVSIVELEKESDEAQSDSG